jgi:WD40 repeat protein
MLLLTTNQYGRSSGPAVSDWRTHLKQVRMWDVPTGKAVETLNHTKAVHAVGVAPGGGGPVAFGGAEGALRLWDSRAPRGEDLVSS